MQRMRVGVLRGGPSSEYEVSLQTGANVLRALSEEKYEPKDIFIDKKGLWHLRGMPIAPERALAQTDVIFNALHGAYGEDGEVQRFLRAHRMPHTGSEAIGAAIAMNKALTKERAKTVGLRTAAHVILTDDDDLDERLPEIFRSFPQPSVIKPLANGSSVGVVIARDYRSFLDGVVSALALSSSVLIEEFISGREATCGVLERFRDEDVYALFPVEIIPPKGTFFDYDAKYKGVSREICPGNFSKEETRELQEAARAAHKALFLRHYSRSDFIVTPRGIYFLEANALPGFTVESLYPKAAAQSGLPFPKLLDHIIGLALA